MVNHIYFQVITWSIHGRLHLNSVHYIHSEFLKHNTVTQLFGVDFMELFDVPIKARHLTRMLFLNVTDC
jgi:hypothetical protein